MDMENNKIYLEPSKVPKYWMNIKPSIGGADALPPLYLPNGKVADFDSLCHVFPVECVKHGGTMEPLIEIPKEVREAYVLCNRPTPIQRAFRLEKALGLNSDKVKIYFKREDVSPSGSHKANAAIPQAFYAKQQGLEGLTTETGAGQWGSALGFACSLYNLKCKVYQVRISYQQKPGRVVLMQSYGADIIPSPSPYTSCGKAIYDKDNNHPGSLGMAISEAVEDALKNPNYRYTLGSVVDFVCLYQTVIGQEAKIQMEMVNDYPDVVIGCIGGGSNFAGMTFPFMKDKLDGTHPNTEIIGVEPTACPSITRGEYRFDYGDTAKMAPICKMYTLGHTFVPPPVHAGGLRYHGASPIVSYLNYHNKMHTVAHHQLEVIKAGILFARTEGLLPAPETCHAVCEGIEQAKLANENNEKKTILINYSGHGHFDIAGYKLYMENKLEDYELPKEDIEKALSEIVLPSLE